MPSFALQPQPAPLTEEEIAARVRAYVQRGAYPLLAAERVVGELCTEGRAGEVLALVGPTALYRLYRDGRPRGPGEPAPAPVGRATRQRHLVALGAETSLLDSLVQVGGTWHRLGDLDRAGCLRAAATQKRAALAIAQQARFYHAVAQRLGDNQRVADVLGDAALRAMYLAAAP